MTDPKITPASLRQLAADHMNDGPPYVKHLYESCQGLRWAADRIEELETQLKGSIDQVIELLSVSAGYCKERDSLRQQLEAAQSEATFQKERADGYSGWITKFEKREARLREALKLIGSRRLLDHGQWTEDSDVSNWCIKLARAALDGEGENE